LVRKTLDVLAHAVVIFRHIELLAGLGSALTPEKVPLFASLANLIPVLAVILLWAHFPKVGGWLLLFLAVPFRVSAVLLFVLELFSCWVAVQILRDSSTDTAADMGNRVNVRCC
jgi:hypothetical protein